MELELNGRIISTKPDRPFIEKTILGMREEGSILTLSSGPLWKRLLVFTVEMVIFLPGAFIPQIAIGLLLIS